MAGGLHGLVPRRRLLLAVVTPVMVAVIATAFALPDAALSTTLKRDGASASAESAESPPSITPAYLRSLRHGLAASLGSPRFAKPPPSAAVGATLGSAAIPGIALAAYRHAAAVLASSDPGCHLSWADVAAIGRVESDNGLTWGAQARVSPNGTVVPAIYGPRLDGRGGVPAYPTPDRGRLEGGGRFERAVGPMQFLPSTWHEYAQDGNGDGQRNPQNFWDASLATAVFLCANGGDVATRQGFDAAVLAYNHSESYVSLVREWAAFYEAAGAARLSALATNLLPEVSRASTAPKHGTAAAPSTSSPPARRRLSPAELVASAVRATEATGTYRASFGVAPPGASSAVATGRLRVDLHDGSSTATIRSVALGRTELRQLRSGSVSVATYVELPANLDGALRVRSGSWLRLSRRLEGALPAAERSVVELASGLMANPVALFAGATSGTVARLGTRRIDGRIVHGYRAGLALGAAAAADRSLSGGIRSAARQLGTDNLLAAMWADRAHVLRRLSIVVPAASGLSTTPLVVRIRLRSFGSAVTISAPTTAPFPPPPPTTTSTTTTSTTTTTTTPPPTTIPPSTTTTTTPPPSTTVNSTATTTSNSTATTTITRQAYGGEQPAG